MKNVLLGAMVLAVSTTVAAQTTPNNKRATTAGPTDVTENSRYTYFQADFIPYQELDADNEDIDGLGGGFDASWHFWEHTYAFGRATFTDLDGDVQGSSVSSDVELYSAGLGFRQGIPEFEGTLDLYSEFSYEHGKLDDVGVDDNNLGDADGDGFGITAGARYLPVSRVEINPSVGYVDYGDNVDGVRFGVRTVVDLTGIFALTAGVDRIAFGNDIDLTTIRLGIRAYLGGDLPSLSGGGFTR